MKPFVTAIGENLPATAIYQRLRRGEEVTSFLLTWHSSRNPEWKRLVSALRRCAQKDGLTVVSSVVSRYGKGDRRNDARVWLVHPDNPTTIVAPDAEKENAS